MKIMRTNYDKPHRCPRWSGPAWKSSRNSDGCADGSIRFHNGETVYEHPWRFGNCQVCGTLTLPYVTRWIDPAWWWFVLKRLRDRRR